MTLPLALTMGEPAGIGGEISLMAWARRSEGVKPFFVLDDPDRLASLARRIALDVPLVAIEAPEAAPGAFARALPVLPIRLAYPATPGKLDPANASAVLNAIRRAVALVRAGKAAAVVTNPIHKHALYEAGFHHPGHTEFLAELAAENGHTPTPVMMLACPQLRVVPVTIHLPIRRAVADLTSEMIVKTGEILARDLAQRFGKAKPRIAVAGLNPHAGEGGALGKEDDEIVRPAIEALKKLGIDATGPWAPDSMFHADARAGYDAALCMYHDQALIPIKTLDFHGGVNVTLGLPFIRTSPDHGTALDIAGSGRANPASLIAALKLAGAMAETSADAA
ncbi:MAG: 4-hydroxythreonine-4-phosphate dehydrogenase PdxA [Alphaproteobacteria bacterium]|nr:4-hydroxythreonine-4-phosphate dehydrogenase PdxA [Alphaproteobacteria bacterium]